MAQLFISLHTRDAATKPMWQKMSKLQYLPPELKLIMEEYSHPKRKEFPM